MSDAVEERLRVPKLTNKNWKAWSIIVCTHLESKGLESLIDTEQNIDKPQTRQQTTEDANAGESLATKDTRARGIILEAVGIKKAIYILYNTTVFAI